MERRFVLFLVTAFAVIFGYNTFVQWLYPPPPRKPRAVAAGKEEAKAAPANPQAEKPQAAKPAAKGPARKPEKAAPEIKAMPEPAVAEQWVTLGSADEKDPYRMLVTLTNRGAAVARIELSSSRYCDIDHRSGYLGQLVIGKANRAGGCLVQLVGPGTPAAEAGLKPGDEIRALGGNSVDGTESLDAVLAHTKPGQTVALTVTRGGKELTLSAKLRRRPLEVIKPEGDDPLSMLLTLQQFDDAKLADEDKEEQEKWDAEDKVRAKGTPEEEAKLKEGRYLGALVRELKGVNLRTANWRVVPTRDKDVVQFRRALPEKGLEITKTYRLVRVPAESQADSNFPAYHLDFDIEIRNIGGKAHKVAYRLDGPNGLPTEGKWYAYKVSRNWGGAGLRDFIISFGGKTPEMTGPSTIAAGKDLPRRSDTPPATAPDALLTYIGVDAQYFSAVLIPQRPNPADAWFSELYPIRVGKVDAEHPNLTNTSCRLVSVSKELQPGETRTHSFRLFTGPKKPAVLEDKAYRLGELIYYGWPIFAVVAVPLTKILHFFYAVVGTYGLAIILLTVLVRSCMFPLSLKQAAGAQKMQLLQPEIKKLAEKHKNNAEARAKAQQELFQKHNYSPLSGCLPIFIQMPVFMGLYRCLMVDIELRDAPLLSHSIRWCSNLAAPDMLYDWSRFMPAFVNSAQGIFGLGPYFNLLPILTIVLFIVQQKIMMPPAADEQAAMQQKMMKYMMIFMGLMFFKVASGLCIYFIASSLWGLGERRFLPKTTPPAGGSGARGGSPSAGGGDVETRADAKARARQLAAKGKK
jgi:YidC/Oxa1 family membrane protein insertase